MSDIMELKPKGKRVTIHQPNLFPRLKVLQKIVHADLWVILDDVQYATREWQNRTRLRYLRQPNCEFWLTIPVHLPMGRCSVIDSISICEYTHTKSYIYKVICYTYHRSKYWNWIDNYISEVLSVTTNNLKDLCVQSASACLFALGTPKTTMLSSELSTRGRRTNKLIEICIATEAGVYISGSGGRSYLNEEEFKSAGIEIEWQSWSAPNVTEDSHALDWRNITFLDFVARFGPDILREHVLDWKEEF